MCGIGGVWCFGNSRLFKSDAEKLRDLAVCLETRGDKAFGFYNGNKVIKFPSSASDVIEMIENIRPFANLVKKKSMFLMHTREPTMGDPLRNKNNHPFELKDIVFAHNGFVSVITEYRDVRVKGRSRKDKRDYGVEYVDSYELFGEVVIDMPETDSFRIGVEIQQAYNKSRDFVEALKGAIYELDYHCDMAIWVYCKPEDKLALYRNYNPLYIAREGKKLWFASEEWMLEAIGLENPMPLDSYEIMVLTRESIIYDPLEGLRRREKGNSWTISDEDLKDAWEVYYYGYIKGGKNRDEEWDEDEDDDDRWWKYYKHTWF